MSDTGTIVDVVDGVHLIEHGRTNCFIVEADDGVTLVDAGFPSTWVQVAAALRRIGRSVDDIRGLVITHGHFDHLGFARHLQHRYAIPVWAHPGDAPLVRSPYGYRPERPRLLYPLTHPRALPTLTAMVAAGALQVPGTRADHDLTEGPLPLPGAPQIIHTPGHTDGECVVVLPDRSAIITGDALVTLDPYTGRRGPRIVARAATHDRRIALASLEPLVATGVGTVLPGHGAVWRDGIEAAVRSAQRDGGA